MIHITIQTLCQVIIAIAAIKYLMPDIRKLCRKIGEEPKKEIEEHKERKEKKYVSAKKANKNKENIEQILPVEKQKEAEVKTAEDDSVNLRSPSPGQRPCEAGSACESNVDGVSNSPYTSNYLTTDGQQSVDNSAFGFVTRALHDKVSSRSLYQSQHDRGFQSIDDRKDAENTVDVSDAETETKQQECQQEEAMPVTETTISAADPEELSEWPEWPDDVSAAPAAEAQKNI